MKLLRTSTYLSLLTSTLLFLASCKDSDSGAQTPPVDPVTVVNRDPDANPDLDAEIKELISQQKYQAAQAKVKELLNSIEKNPTDEKSYIAHINTFVKLEMALHGYETAVKTLRTYKRPKGQLAQWSLDLIYAQSLFEYYSNYSWEINQREKIQSSEKDLKQWTADEIFYEIIKTYASILKDASQLAAKSRDDLKEILHPNNYPKDIRGTLLDSVTHLFANILINRQYWQAQDESDIASLPLAQLLDFQRNTEVDFLNRSTHPLEKISLLYRKLYQVHQKAGKSSAALDAQISLYETLHGQFSAEEDKQLILATFRKTLDKNSSLEWFSWGQAAYANTINSQGQPDSHIKAKQLAEIGIKAHPNSQGARNCRELITQIEGPSYSMQAMALDTQGKRSIEINYKNISKLYFRSYAYDLRSHIKSNKDYSYFLDYRDFEKINKDNPTQKWAVDLKSTTDFNEHRHFVTPPKHTSGFYLVYASTNESFDQENNSITGAQMIFSDLVITKDNTVKGGKLSVQILNGQTGQPVGDVDVSLYQSDYQKGPKKIDSQKTNKEGFAHYKESTLRSKRGEWRSFFMIAEKDKQFSVSLNPFSAQFIEQSPMRNSSFLIADRSVYRPGQKLYFKSISYSGNSETGNFKVSAQQNIQISLVDGNHQTVQTLDLKTDQFGSAFGEFVIPAGRLLGQWGLRSSQGAHTSVRVEEYKRPTFEVQFPEQKKAWKLNEKVSIAGEAKYYFGGALSSGSVTYEIYSQLQLPWWCYMSGFRFFWSDYSGRKLIKTGKTKINGQGNFEIEFTPKVDARLSKSMLDLVSNYSVEVHVTDEGGETREQTKSFQIGLSDIRLSLATEKIYSLSTENIKFTAHRQSLNGSPRAGLGEVSVYRLKPRHTLRAISDYPLPQKILDLVKVDFSTTGDLQRRRTENNYSMEQHISDWVESEKVFQAKITHDLSGKGEFILGPQASGAYRVKLIGKDTFGQPVEVIKEILIAGAQSQLELPFIAMLQNSDLKPGDSAQLFVHSGYKNQRFVVEKTRFGQSLQKRIWVAGVDSSLINFPITEGDRGGFELSVHMLNDFSFQRQVFSINVPWTNKELKIEFSKFRDELKPGTKEKWTLSIKGADSSKVDYASTQILSFMFDKSLEAIAPYHLSSMSNVYGRSYLQGNVNADLGIAPHASMRSNGFHRNYHGVNFNGDTLSFYPSYGIGGPGARGNSGRFRSKGGFGGGDLDGAIMESASDMEGGAPQMKAMSAPAVAMEKVSAKKEKKDSFKDEVSDKRQDANTASTDANAGSELRTQFQETAFFKPDLLLNKNGGVDIEFTVPDSVTTWKVYALAHTQDFKSGVSSREARTIKDLLVRPYLPRFLREGDRFILKTVINNSSANPLSGKLNIQILQHDTQKDITSQFVKDKVFDKNFQVAAKAETSISFTLDVPKSLGQVDIKVMGSSGAFKDGELKPLVVLPSTLHLAESVFKIIKDKDKKVLNFKDLEKSTDPTRVNEKLVVTLNSQLFYNVLSAMPYLVNYPYECTEQTLNRFLSTGILGSLYKEFPAVSKMAKSMSTRDTRLEKWDPTDPNRRLGLEESPWLVTSKGGSESPENLTNVLDERIVRAQREESISKLRKAQTSLGGFPWFPGGAPSPYMTLYILHGFSKALEFGVDVPKDMIQNAWSYMHRHYIEQIVPYAYQKNCCWEEITFLNYVLSNFPNSDWYNNLFPSDERARMAEFSFKHWKNHSPYLKGYLALTLQRLTRVADAKLVWESVLDSAKVSEEEGTHWAREDRSWLWYNDTTETHAFALRTGMELKSSPKLLDGLVLWLFLNKKLNHWSSTRSTSEVIYSLAHYLKATKQLGVREEATVSFANGYKQSFDFPADVYMGGKNQIVLEGDKITTKSVPITVEKSTPGYLFASATWHYATDQLPKEDKGDFLKVSRRYFKRSKNANEFILEPITSKSSLKVGDEIEVQISMSSKHEMEYVHLRDPRPSGFEPVSVKSGHKWDMGISWFEEIRDSGTNFFFERLPHGEYNFKYRVRVAASGTFKIGSAEVQAVYAPEFVAHSAGQEIKVSE